MRTLPTTTSVGKKAVGCRLLAVGCLLFALPAYLGCQDATAPRIEAQLFEFSGPTMGTRYSVKLFTKQRDASLEFYQTKVNDRLAEINRRMSTYDPESELSRFNQSESTDWFAVSEETAKVVGFALEVAQQTGGAFDPTVGPVVNLWGFGPDGRRAEPPSDEEVSAALARVGYTKVSARLDPPALRKQHADVYVDLSAVAKGYASDAVSECLAGEASMVEIGGEIMCRGTKPDASRWQIGVEKPNEQGRAIQTVVALTDQALATSGDYRNFFESGGQRFSHTLNPQSGRPVEHRLATVSVQADACMAADAYATAILVMGPQEGYNWAEERGLAALLIERTADGFAERATTAWTETQKP